jgi:hypothetical protein
LIVLGNNGKNKYFLTDEPPKTAKDKKALDYPRALITAISKKLIAWQDDVIRHSLKTKLCYAYISAGFRYSFHQEITLTHTPLDSSEGMLNDSFTLGTLIGFAFFASCWQKLYAAPIFEAATCHLPPAATTIVSNKRDMTNRSLDASLGSVQLWIM